VQFKKTGAIPQVQIGNFFLIMRNHNKTLQIVAKLLHRFLTSEWYEQYSRFPKCGLFYKI